MVEVSVICLAYNHEKYIEECIQHLLSQKTDFQYEVLIHDDASTDRTPEILRKYAQEYPDIIKPILQKENQFSQGKILTSEFIFPKCEGKYYCMCECDDYWCDDQKLQKQYDFMEAHPEYSACVHNSILHDCNNGKETLVNASETDKDIEMKEVLLDWGKVYHTSSMFYRKEFANRPKEFYARGFGDYPRAIYFCHVGKVHYFADVMSVHRVNVENSWTTKNVASRDPQDVIKHYRKVIELLNNIDAYTEQKYHSDIVKAVRWNECLILQWQDNAKEILKSYRDVYEGMSKGRKAIIQFKAYFPKTFKFLNNIRLRGK